MNYWNYLNIQFFYRNLVTETADLLSTDTAVHPSYALNPRSGRASRCKEKNSYGAPMGGGKDSAKVRSDQRADPNALGGPKSGRLTQALEKGP